MEQYSKQGANLFELTGLPPIRLTDREKKYFANSDFQSRVTEGVRRVAKQKAESGFIVGTLRRRQTVFPMMYGTAFADPYEEGVSVSGLFGSNTSAEVDPVPYIDNLNALLKRREGRNYTPFNMVEEYPISIDASFHFHPDTSGFSDPDIQHFDDLTNEATIPERKRYLVAPTSKFRYGLFFPLYKRSFLASTLSGLGYISISGTPSRTEYQGVLLHRLSAPEQVKLFQDCGFDVSHAVILVTGRKPHFGVIR